MPESYQKYHQHKRTEEVQDIIERMPTHFARYTSYVVLVIFTLLFVFGWFIKYPDIVVGQITLNTTISPIKLVANSSGKLHLNTTASQSEVREGQVIAYIENPTPYDTLVHIKNKLLKLGQTHDATAIPIDSLPKQIALGELSPKYYQLLYSLQQWYSFANDKPVEEQIQNLQKLYRRQLEEIENGTQRMELNGKNLETLRKMHLRDSVLFHRGVIAAAEYDRSSVNYVESQNNYNNYVGNVIALRKQAQQTLNSISELDTGGNIKKNELELAANGAYRDLLENIEQWEQRYLLKAPFSGTVQHLKFWTDNQFVQSGESLFTVIPSVDNRYGQMLLPANGAGKVETGQRVIVKFDDFPYMEYGIIDGRVEAISLSKNEQQTQQGVVQTYLVHIIFENGLTTNYGKELDFRQETAGMGEIITKDRRLVERLFDNLKYAVNK